MRNDLAKQKPGSYPIAFLLKRLMQLFRDSLDEALRPNGITSAQLHVLAALDREPGISGARLARYCQVTPQTTQVLLRGVEANGWIRRHPHPENRRVLLATLTPTGRRILVRSRKAIAEIYSQMVHALPPQDVSTLESLLSRCAANLEARNPHAVEEGCSVVSERQLETGGIERPLRGASPARAN